MSCQLCVKAMIEAEVEVILKIMSMAIIASIVHVFTHVYLAPIPVMKNCVLNRICWQETGITSLLYKTFYIHTSRLAQYSLLFLSGVSYTFSHVLIPFIFFRLISHSIWVEKHKTRSAVNPDGLESTYTSI